MVSQRAGTGSTELSAPKEFGVSANIDHWHSRLCLQAGDQLKQKGRRGPRVRLDRRNTIGAIKITVRGDTSHVERRNGFGSFEPFYQRTTYRRRPLAFEAQKSADDVTRNLWGLHAASRWNRQAGAMQSADAGDFLGRVIDLACID